MNLDFKCKDYADYYEYKIKFLFKVSVVVIVNTKLKNVHVILNTYILLIHFLLIACIRKRLGGVARASYFHCTLIFLNTEIQE